MPDHAKTLAEMIPQFKGWERGREALQAAIAMFNNSGDGLAQHFKIVQLEGEVSAARNVVSRALNTLEQVQIALEEDDHDEALRLVKEARGVE